MSWENFNAQRKAMACGHGGHSSHDGQVHSPSSMSQMLHAHSSKARNDNAKKSGPEPHHQYDKEIATMRAEKALSAPKGRIHAKE